MPRLNNASGSGVDMVARIGLVINTFDDLIDHGKTIQGFGFGVIEEFEDETGLDAALSSVYNYEATDDYYHNPTRVASFLTGGTATATNNYAGNPPSQAVDLNTSTAWQGSGATLPKYWQYDLGAGNSADAVKVRVNSDTLNGAINAFTVTASNTGAFAGEEVTYATGNFTNVTGWQEVTFSAQGAYYRYYRINTISIYPTAANTPWVSEFELHQVAGAPNMTLVSAASAAGAAPANGQLIMLAEAVDVFTINTDLVASISSDGGTTFDVVSLVDYGDHGSGLAVLAGSVALTGGGSSMRWKSVVANNKELRIHGVGVLWD